MKGRIWQLYIIAIIGIALVSEFLGTSRTIFAIDKVIKDGESIEIVIDENADSTTEKFSVRKDGVSTASTGTELFTIQESGNVGIGTTNLLPRAKLDVALGNDEYVLLTGDGSNPFRFSMRSAGEQSYFLRHSGTSNLFQIGFDLDAGGQQYAVTVNSSGNVGIGTTAPQHPLHMGSGAHVTVGGVWTNASSREYKENIRDLTVDEAVATLDGLRPTKFNYKVDKEDECLGFIAEDVPQLVATNDRKGLSPMDFTTVLTKVVQEQQRMLKEQQEAMSEMKQEIQMLKSAVNYRVKGL